MLIGATNKYMKTKTSINFELKILFSKFNEKQIGNTHDDHQQVKKR